jgi:hypothetical protein
MNNADMCAKISEEKSGLVGTTFHRWEFGLPMERKKK